MTDANHAYPRMPLDAAGLAPRLREHADKAKDSLWQNDSLGRFTGAKTDGYVLLTRAEAYALADLLDEIRVGNEV